MIMTEENILQGELAGILNPPEPNPRQRILVVEDDAAIRQVNQEVLTYSGYHVDGAEDGAAAWAALQQINYDLVVTDNDMPKVPRVPKVTVTREGISLCQKGVTRWPLFLVNCWFAPKRVKTSRGRASSLSSRPLRSKVRETFDLGFLGGAAKFFGATRNVLLEPHDFSPGEVGASR
jgi:response regulator RpfG family c-di-GMP phosphodiesterase